MKSLKTPANTGKKSEILLGKEDPAPRNRTIILTRADLERFQPKMINCQEPLCLAAALDRIFLSDCVEGMRVLPPACVNLVVADPPYNIAKDFGEGSISLTETGYREWTRRWLAEAHRVLKPDGSIYVCCDWRHSGTVQAAIKEFFTVKNRITWKRDKGRGARANWKNNMEDIWFAVKNPDAYTFNLEEVLVRKEVVAPYTDEGGNPKDWVIEEGCPVRYSHPSNIWTDLVVPFWSMPENTPHPTQKPERLIERILRASSNADDIVLDPFMGSGTTAVVARRLARHYIGFEVNPHYVSLGLKRLAQDPGA